METKNVSAGDISTAIRSASESLPALAAPSGAAAFRNGDITIHQLIDAYMAAYAGRDSSRLQRLTFWVGRLGPMRLVDLSDDEVFLALEDLATQRGRFFAGHDADGKPIYRSKRKPLSGATLNRYAAALGATITWAIRKRIAPKNFINPVKAIERKAESPGVVRFLSDDERNALLTTCRSSKWPRLYLLVLMAITTGARRGELERLRWRDIDFDHEQVVIHLTKNGDSRVLPLVPNVIEELRRHIGPPGALVFASTRRPDVAFNTSPVWQHALRTAGIKHFRFHDLRHSCASYLAQSGETLLAIGDLLGHRSLAVTKRYSHLATKDKAAMVSRVLGGIK